MLLSKRTVVAVVCRETYSKKDKKRLSRKTSTDVKITLQIKGERTDSRHHGYMYYKPTTDPEKSKI